MPSDRAERAALIAVLLLAALLRLVACVLWSPDLSRDPDAYRGLAERLAAGEGYVAPDGRPTAFRPPLYPLLLAAVLPAGTAGIATLHIALGVATVALTASLARQLGQGRWSLLAAALVAVDPLLLRYTPHVMTEVTCTFLATLLLRLAAGRDGPAHPPSSSGEGPGLRGQSEPTAPLASAPTSSLISQPSTLNPMTPLTLGATCALAALSRPTFLAFGLLIALAWLWDRFAGEREASAPRAPRLRQAALVLLGTSLLFTPWALRNALAFGHPLVTTTHGGYTLLLANNPVFWREVVAGPPGTAWSGRSLDAWQRSLETRMTADGVPHDELARDRWMRDQAISHIRAEPATFLRAAAYRLARFWSVAPSVESVPAVARWAVVLFYLATYACAAIGLARLMRMHRRAAGVSPQAAPRPLRPWRPAFLLIAAFTAVHAVYWTDARMRAPLVPAVALLAARGLAVRSPAGRARQKTPET